MNTNKKVIFVILFFGVLFMSYNIFISHTATNEISQNLDCIIEDVDNRKSDNSLLMLSSNPYDYIKNNIYYEKIISMGYKALYDLEYELNKANTSGLREYIICIAIEEITQSDLKQFKEFQWDRAKVFAQQWDQYLRKMPELVRDIIESEMVIQEKEEALIKLGAPAIPYVIQYDTFLQSLDHSEILSEFSNMFRNKDVATTMDKFVEVNRDTIQSFQQYIEQR